MRSIAIIAACAVWTCNARLAFDRPVALPDAGLAVPLLSNATAEPLELPRATSFLVESDGVTTLEDRYVAADLWLAETVRGRWIDEDGNELMIARFATEPPTEDDAVLTRTAYAARARRIDPKNLGLVKRIARRVMSDPNATFVRPRRSQRRHLQEFYESPSTNACLHSYLVRPKAAEEHQTTDWYLIQLLAAPETDADWAKAVFDGDFFDALQALKPSRGEEPPATEDGWLRRAVRRNVVNYDDWHVADGGDVMVVDDLYGGDRDSVLPALTNDLPRLRQAFAARFPATAGETNRTAVVRLFNDRADYLAYAGSDVSWTAAYWSPLRRELVAFLSGSGSRQLVSTLKHEAFHQYFSYAGRLATASPWFDEGHADLFRNGHFTSEGEYVFDLDDDAAGFVRENVETLAELIPTVILEDHAAFYAGTDLDRYSRYALAWSMAYFLEIGAPKIRLQPFGTVRGDYLTTLVSTRDARRATAAALPPDRLKKFVAAWVKFWRNN